MIDAYRIFDLTGSGVLLSPTIKRWKSVAKPIIGPVMGPAGCALSHGLQSHIAPYEYCSCGLYGVRAKTVEEFFVSIPSQYHSFYTRKKGFRFTFSVVAKVGLYGRIIEHERGYRASHLVIRHLWLLHNGRQFSTHFMGLVAGRFQCDTEQRSIKSVLFFNHFGL